MIYEGRAAQSATKNLKIQYLRQNLTQKIKFLKTYLFKIKYPNQQIILSWSITIYHISVIIRCFDKNL